MLITTDCVFKKLPTGINIHLVQHTYLEFQSCLFQAKDTRVCDVEFNQEFIARVIPKLDWPEVVKAAEGLGQVCSKVNCSLLPPHPQNK